MNKKVKKILFSACVLITGLTFIVTAYGYDPKARLMPIIVGLPTVVLAAIQLISELVKKEDQKKNGYGEDGVEFMGEQEQASQSTTMAIYLSLAVMVLMVYVLGFLVSIPLFLFGFTVLISKARVWVAALFSVAFTVVVYALFVTLLHAQLYKGLIF